MREQLLAAATATAALLCSLMPGSALGQALGSAQPGLQQVPMRITTSLERITLPGDEGMGLMGGNVLLGLGNGWWAGPAVYGAATGQRGGLFVLGGEVQKRWRLGERLALDAGLYAGGGGGGAAPVGGGLMLRSAATLMHDFGPMRAGLSASHVRFHNGDIRSNQLGLVLEFGGRFTHYQGADIGRAIRSTGASGLGFDRLAATVDQYRLRGTGVQTVGLVGAKAEAQSHSGWVYGMESAAAATGGAAGYMEILASVASYHTPTPHALPHFNLHGRLALGLGGGGAIPVGGGLIGKWALGANLQARPGLTLGLELGQVLGLNGPLRASTLRFWAAGDLEAPRFAGAGSGHVSHNEFMASLQQNLHAQRRDGSRKALSTMGMKLNRYMGPHLYLSGQAHSAFAGDAGAYSIGLVGAGLATSRRSGNASTAQFGVELLAGAAGGAGVATGGGLIAQGMAWAAVSAGPDAQWRMGLGAVRSLRGGTLSTPVVEVGWVKTLGLGGR